MGRDVGMDVGMDVDMDVGMWVGVERVAYICVRMWSLGDVRMSGCRVGEGDFLGRPGTVVGLCGGGDVCCCGVVEDDLTYVWYAL